MLFDVQWMLFKVQWMLFEVQWMLFEVHWMSSGGRNPSVDMRDVYAWRRSNTEKVVIRSVTC